MNKFKIFSMIMWDYEEDMTANYRRQDLDWMCEKLSSVIEWLIIGIGYLQLVLNLAQSTVHKVSK